MTKTNQHALRSREYVPPQCELTLVRLECNFMGTGDPNRYTTPDVEEEDLDWES